MKIKCVIATTTASGSPYFDFCIVECTQAQYDLGQHYDSAEDYACEEGYEGDMIVYDENDGPKFLFDHFAWDSAYLVTVV
jgi:hypothetical protein